MCFVVLHSNVFSSYRCAGASGESQPQCILGTGLRLTRHGNHVLHPYDMSQGFTHAAVLLGYKQQFRAFWFRCPDGGR